MATHLERLLFAQGGRCFFCGDTLSRADASVEHLVAQAKSSAFPAGGSSHDDNCVACCKALNHLLGAKSIKEKLSIVLAQGGSFRCPTKAFNNGTDLGEVSVGRAVSSRIKQSVPSAPSTTKDLVSPATPALAIPAPTFSSGVGGMVKSDPLPGQESECASPPFIPSSESQSRQGPEPSENLTEGTTTEVKITPAPSPARACVATMPPDEWPTFISERLEGATQNRPAKLATLHNFVRASLATYQPSEAAVTKVIDQLLRQGAVHVIGDKLHYGFSGSGRPSCKPEWLAKVVESLIKSGKSRPRKVKTLTAFASAALNQYKPKPAEVVDIIRALQERGYLLIEAENVGYKLPKAT
jgi:hypothetical protein